MELQNFGKLEYRTLEEEQVENYRKMILAMGKDIRVILIKLSDRLHNMRTLDYLSKERQYFNAKETMELYAPLANRLGIYSMKCELENLSFKYLYPDEYKEVSNDLEQKRVESMDFINNIMDEINVALKKERIQAEITGREKHLYSIYRKMKRDNKTIDQIYDLFALRIFVNSIKDCYASLGIVHELFNPLPGRFKDYISLPKPNMYQSLHNTLIGPKGTPFEIQIRTYDMHRVAEYGIAAHWAYKEKGKNTITTDDKLAWLREALEWQKDTQDPEEFMATLKTELFEDEVYVFTPRGDIKVLPKGSTPIDFAYNIHAEVGHRMTGVKINSRMMPITTKLSNGDIIDIISSDASKGPSRDWLKFVKSSQARTRIQQWFKKAEREQNIEKGKEIINKEIKRIGIEYSELFKTDWVQLALDRYKFPNLEDMYANIGASAISPAKIIAKLLEEYRKEHIEEKIEEKLQELNNTRPNSFRPSKTGIIVKGIDNCLIKISKCCNPLPGDKIIGYITKGRGVTIHRASCLNVSNLVSEENRLIDVYWDSTGQTSYNVDIGIFANDRPGLLSNIITELGNMKVKLIAVNSKSNKERIASTELTLQVEDQEELNKIIKTLRKIDSVYEVKRRK